MERHSTQSGYDLVLDIRRLIIGFAILILVCGIFFLLGFVEGKRQAVQSSLREPGTPAPTVLPEPPKEVQAPASSASAAGKAADEKARTQLDWYDAVSETPKSRANGPKTPAAAAAAVRSSPKPQASSVAPKSPTRSTYSCQVGAFSQRKEAEAKLSSVKARGYSPFIEAPQTSKGYYLLKVGRFNTRAEAAEMQLRLKKDGIASFIKTNQ